MRKKNGKLKFLSVIDDKLWKGLLRMLLLQKHLILNK
jgi:hypothetical protein